MRVIVVGGSASNVGKTTLAVRLTCLESRQQRTVAMKVSVRERPCTLRVLVFDALGAAEHRRDSERFLEAGAAAVVWVTVARSEVRQGLAAGLARARQLRPEVLVVESTSAGIELKGPIDSWFISGDGEWKPWAFLHRNRAHHVLRSDDVLRWDCAAL